MTDQKPTGVFVRLPLSNEQLGKLLAPTGPLNERLLSIGTPVAGGELEKTIHQLVCAGIRNALVSNWSAGVCALHAKADLLAQEVMAGKPEAVAELAARDAEIVRLRNVINKMTSMSMNSGAWLSNNRIANCRDELSAMTRQGSNTLKVGAA